MNKQKKQWASLLFACLLSMILGGCSMNKVKELPQNSWSTAKSNRVSIHDPSITAVLNQEGHEEYYVFGSHLAEAKTKDLLTWEVPFTTEYEEMEKNIIFDNTQENLAETFEWAGYDDADSSGGYSLWAPDVIWNSNYEWPDKTKGAYMLYYSASSTWRRSAIGLAVAKTIEGPYSYVSTIIYSGFTKKDSTDGSDRNINFNKTNVKQLIDEGTVNGFSDNWSIEDGKTYNTNYAPNAIDPALFYDEEDKLWMTYGSWSGGIFLLEIDPATGEPIYPGEDAVTDDGRVVDRYFGIKLSGGNHQSGEGPYIVYDQKTKYYYLFVTYGGLSAKGGYNMRLFRSEKPDGPYIDAQGNTPIIENGNQNTQYGIKLIGNYQFADQKVGFRSAGHNSAFIDKDGQWYLIFHTRFNNGSENHEVRIHSMFMNEEQWPMTAPLEYRGTDEIAGELSNKEICGSYEWINHGTDNGKTMIKTQAIELNEDGTITGDISGKWQQTKGLITLTISKNIFKGVLLQQETDEKESPSLTFSAVGDNNESIWGKKIN